MTYSKCKHELVITIPWPYPCGHCDLVLAPPCTSHGPAHVLVVARLGLLFRAIVAQPCILLMLITAGHGLLLLLMDVWPGLVCSCLLLVLDMAPRPVSS